MYNAVFDVRTLLLAGVHSADAEGEGFVGDALEAGGAHRGGELLLAGEGGDGGGEVGVGGLVSGDLSADLREDVEEIEVVEPSDDLVLRAGQFEKNEAAAGLQDSAHLAEAFLSVLEVPDSERYGDPVESVVGEAEVLAVAFLD